MLNEGSVPFSQLSRRFRSKRFAHVISMIDDALRGQEEVSILDVGGRAAYWSMLPPAYRGRVNITILNYEAELGGESVPSNSGLHLTTVVGNGCNMPEFADRSFDLVHCNSVVEHLGSYRNMVDFANEVRRVGRAYYVQTPNLWFPIDPHRPLPFLHWLPDHFGALMFMKHGNGGPPEADYASAMIRVENCRMVTRAMMKALFPDGRHLSERFLFVMTKSLIVQRSAH